MTKISDLSALTGASVDAANDLITVIDASETGAAKNKKMTFAELLIGVAAVPLTYLDADGTLAANSDTKVATQKAVKTAIAAAVTGLLELKGSTDCSANPNYPAASKGDAYVVSVSGKIGGASGATVSAGDVYFATADNAGGTQASVGTSWDVIVHSGGTGSAIAAKDEGSTLTSGVTSLNFVGAGVTATNSSGDVTVTIPSSAGNKWLLQWGPLLNEAPSSNFATLDTRNGHLTLDFDTTTQEAAIFSGVLPADYGGAGITVSIFCALTSAITGTVGWLVSIERNDASTLDIDADSFASAQTVTATTVPGTSGQLLKLSVNISNGANMDSLAAGELFRMKVERDVTNDTAAGDAELLRVTMKEQ